MTPFELKLSTDLIAVHLKINRVSLLSFDQPKTANNASTFFKLLDFLPPLPSPGEIWENCKFNPMVLQLNLIPQDLNPTTIITSFK